MIETRRGREWSQTEHNWSGKKVSERKRQKARDRYASMTDEQKAQRNAKRRENYHRKKAESRVANMIPEKTDIGEPVDSATNIPPETPGKMMLASIGSIKMIHIQGCMILYSLSR